jgi:hypothetical protein
MNNMKPTQMMILGGGVLLLIGSFLDWFSVGPFGANAYDSDLFGLTGILILLLSIELIAVSAIQAFAPQVNLPEKLLGYSLAQLTAVAALAAFLTAFGQWFRSNSAIGVFLAGIGAGVALAGAIWEQQQGASSTGGNANPTTF